MNADEDQLETIIQYMMGERKNYDMSFMQELLGGQLDYSEWKVDKVKLISILFRTTLWAEKSLDYIHEARNNGNSDMARNIVDERSHMLQRITLLNVVNDIENFRGKYKSDNPTISISFDEDETLELKFLEFANASSDYNPIFTNLTESKVTISYTKLGSEIDNVAVDGMKSRFAGYFGNSSLVKDTGKFIIDETNSELIDAGTDQLTEYATKKFGKGAVSKLVGLIPFAGDVASFALDVSVASNEAEQQNEFMEAEFKELDSALVYADFDCCVNFVEYDIFNNEEHNMFVYPGERTDEIIARLNEKFGTNLNRKMVLSDSNVVNEEIQNLRRDPDNSSIVEDIMSNKDN